VYAPGQHGAMRLGGVFWSCLVWAGGVVALALARARPPGIHVMCLVCRRWPLALMLAGGGLLNVGEGVATCLNVGRGWPLALMWQGVATGRHVGRGGLHVRCWQ
jgi:hypothetical protein